MRRPIRRANRATRWVWASVHGSRASMAAASAYMACSAWSTATIGTALTSKQARSWLHELVGASARTARSERPHIAALMFEQSFDGSSVELAHGPHARA